MASTHHDRGTKINMALVPTLDMMNQTPDRQFSPPTHQRPASPKKKNAHDGETTGDIEYDSQARRPASHSFASMPVITRGSPWERYQKVYELNLGGFVSVVFERAAPKKLFIVKQLQGAREVNLLQTIRHKNFHSMLNCFSFEKSYFAVFSHEPISLAHIAKAPPYLNELQLAAIVGQILEGLEYLVANDLRPSTLTCSNILIGMEGEIMITGHESCKNDTSCTQVLKDIGYITMELMQKYSNSSGSIGLEDFDRWPSDGHAVSFLAMTTSAVSVAQLLSHPLLDCNWQKEDLVWIVSLAAVTTHRGYRYKDTKAVGVRKF